MAKKNKNKTKSAPRHGGKYSAFSFWLAWSAIFILYVGIRVNTVAIPLDRDEGLFGYTGQVILDHGLPYKDSVDHKPPSVYYIYALALLFFRQPLQESMFFYTRIIL